MILEFAILDVKPKQEKYFEAAFEKVKNIRKIGFLKKIIKIYKKFVKHYIIKLFSIYSRFTWS